MAHKRDYQIAVLLKKEIILFFHKEQIDIPISIIDVVLLDRRTAHIIYIPKSQEAISVIDIEKFYLLLSKLIPKIKKHIAKNTNLKAIPTLHFALDANFTLEL